MRDKKRIKRILSLIEELWSQNYDMRFFQFCINFTTLINYKDSDPWFYEDDTLIKALKYRMKQLKPNKKTKERC